MTASDTAVAPPEDPSPAVLEEIRRRLAAIEVALAPDPPEQQDKKASTLLDRLDPEPRTLVRFHLCMMCAWIGLVVPTVLWWKESILWVAFMSLYANFVGHFSGWDAARAEESNDANSA